MKLSSSFKSGFLLILIFLLNLILQVETKSTLYSIITAILFILVFVFFISFDKKPTKRIKKLPEDYQLLYTIVEGLVTESSLQYHDKRDVQVEILEILEEGARTNKEPIEVVNGSAKGLVLGITSKYGSKPSLIYLISYSSFLFSIYIIFMKVSKIIKLKEDTTLNLGIIILFLIICYIFAPILKIVSQKATRECWVGPKKMILALPFLIPTAIFIGIKLIKNPSFVNFINTSTPIMSTPITLILWVVIGVVSFIVMNKTKTK